MGQAATWTGFKLRFLRDIPEHGIRAGGVAVIPHLGGVIRVFNPDDHATTDITEGTFLIGTDFAFIDDYGDDNEHF